MRTFFYSSLFIALAAAVLTEGTFRVYGQGSSSPALMVVVFSATLLIYNLDRLIGGLREDRSGRSSRHIWVGEHRKKLWGLVGVGAVGIVLGTCFLSPVTLTALVLLGTISFLYALPLIGRSGKNGGWRLKEAPGLKTCAVATVWALVTAVLPALELGEPVVSREVLETFGMRWIFIFALTLPFDLRDRRGDREAGIRTLAVILGAKKTLVMAAALMVVVTIWGGVGFFINGDEAAAVMALIGAVTFLGFWPLWKDVGEEQGPGELYYLGFLDGMLLVQGLLLLAL